MFGTVVETPPATTMRPIELVLLINATTLGSQHFLVSDALFDGMCQQVRKDADGNVDVIKQGFAHLVATIINTVTAGQNPEDDLVMMAITCGAVLHGTPAPENRTYLLRIQLDGQHECLCMDESIKEGLDTSEGAWKLWHRTQEMVDLAVAEAKGSA
ncbi:hypothetical protein GGE65_007707 [Skermanella aerolata]|uniref:hypothetical protein n=1 Tax=Skermanella aerolata TaxID=393310 RepID=UPI003D21C2E1